MFSFTDKIKQFLHIKNNSQIKEQTKKVEERDSLRYSEDHNQKEDDEDTLRYSQIDDNQTINYELLEERLEEHLSQILQGNKQKEYRNSIQNKKKAKTNEQKKIQRKMLFQKYKKGSSYKEQDKQLVQNTNVQKQFDLVFNCQQSFCSRFFKKTEDNQEKQKNLTKIQTLQEKQQERVKENHHEQIHQESNQEESLKNFIQLNQQNKMDSLVVKQQQSQSKIILQLLNEDNQNNIQQKKKINNSQQIIKENGNGQVQKLKQNSQKQFVQQLNSQSQNKKKIDSVIIRSQQNHILQQKNYPCQFQLINQQKNKPNFNYINKPLHFNIAETNKVTFQSKKPKVNFKYGEQTQSNFSNSDSLKTKIIFQDKSKQNLLTSYSTKVIYVSSTNEQKTPLFMQRLNRINCYLPNLNIQIRHPYTLLLQLKSVIQNVQSALTFLQLLYQKIKYKIQAIKRFNLFLIQNLNNSNILQIFLKGDWKNIEQFTEIQYVKPKQSFFLRGFIPEKFTQAINNFKQNCKHYINYEIHLQSQQGKEKYLKIRKIFFVIQAKMKTMSEDLYCLWLTNCHFPYEYKVFYNYLKQQMPRQPFKWDQSSILAHLIQLQQLKDPLALSIVGKAIEQKIKQNQENEQQRLNFEVK